MYKLTLNWEDKSLGLILCSHT